MPQVPHTLEIYPFRFEAESAETRVLSSAFWAPAPLNEVFDFFSQAENLEALTPAQLQFKILTPLPIKMQVGTRIDYAISLHGLPMRWRTLIPVWEPPHRFVDLQLRGPYLLWEHEHRFQSREGGTLISDRVRYRSPGPAWAQALFVQPNLKNIFTYRFKKMQSLWPSS